MQFLNWILYASLGLAMVSAFSWKSATKMPSGREHPEVGYDEHTVHKSSQVDLKQSRNRANELYASAMLQLKRLEEEPICHRVAAQLLMSNCQGLENINQKEYDLYSGRIQRHYVESLAASLAICDMERSSMVVPDACESFRLPSLLRASQEGEGKLQITQDEVGVCLEGLGKNPSHWLSWTSYRDNCLLICQVARSDIEKDQSILLQKRLVEIMEQFTANLENDLHDLNRHMADHARTAESYFEGIYSRAEALKNKVEGAFEIISTEASGITSSMKSILGSFGDIQRMMHTVVETVVHSHAEMAAAQEQALVATSGTAKSRMEDINALASNTEASFERLNYAIRFEALSIGINNMTALINEHAETLEQASFTASNIQENLGKAAMGALDSVGELALDYSLRLLSPLLSLYVGNYGVSASSTRNIVLCIGGYGIGESAVQIRNRRQRIAVQIHHCHRWIARLTRDCCYWMPRVLQTRRPRASTQLPRDSILPTDYLGDAHSLFIQPDN
ncbi:hypothetical protein ACMFMG_005893 [Clarireedia jacksonii]